MKFNFKIQQYQTDAVDAVVQVFQGQGYHDRISYIRDKGKRKKVKGVDGEDVLETAYVQKLEQDAEEDIDLEDDTGYKNELIELSDEQLLQNIHRVQSQNNIRLLPIWSKIWDDALWILRWKPVLARHMFISRQCLS